ncbi:MAG TPA: ROK family protein, partial [Ktedonobacterales bacterium]|nr:ROK family protein [Ktedonobacterales bacterium]
ISEVAAVESTGGRRPILLSINPTLGYVVGVKLREDSMTLAICDLCCTVLYSTEAEIVPGAPPYETFDAISVAIEHAIQEAGISRQRVLGAGIGMAGFIDSAQGVCRNSAIMGWRDVRVQAPLEYKLRMPVRIDNDVNTLAVAERLFGQGRSAANFVLVTIGRGIGLGIVMGGEIYRGTHGGAGEFGHTVIDLSHDALECNCGKRGCLEAIASDYGILRAALQRDPGHHVEHEMQQLLERAREPEIQRIFARAGAALGAAIANLINVFDPEFISLTGEGLRAGDVLLQPMREAIPLHTFGPFDPVALRTSMTTEVDWARGSASLILQEIFRPPIHDTDETVMMGALLALARPGGRRAIGTAP